MINKLFEYWMIAWLMTLCGLCGYECVQKDTVVSKVLFVGTVVSVGMVFAKICSNTHDAHDEGIITLIPDKARAYDGFLNIHAIRAYNERFKAKEQPPQDDETRDSQ